jgi:hypothetical protein
MVQGSETNEIFFLEKKNNRGGFTLLELALLVSKLDFENTVNVVINFNEGFII